MTINPVSANTVFTRTPAERISVIVQNPVDSFAFGLDTQVKSDLSLINAVEMEVTPETLKRLEEAAEHSPMRVFRNEPIAIIEPIPEEVGIKLNTAGPSVGADRLWERGLTGKGVTVAVVDTGIAPHPDVRDRIIGFKDFVNGRSQPYDDQGHGTHVAGTVAGDGRASEGSYTGIAPEASLVGIKVLDGQGSGRFSDVIKGIQWAVEHKDDYGIKVLNLSLGGGVSTSHRDDPVVQAVEAATRAGIVTVVAAGNEGPSRETIGSPGNAPNVITVGAADDRGTVDRSDDQVARFSSRGPTPIDGLNKPDVLAPGVRITAADNESSGYKTLSGTSMATPVTAGVTALLLQGEPGARPQDVKEALMASADPLTSGGRNDQGRGSIDAVAALQHLERRGAQAAA